MDIDGTGDVCEPITTTSITTSTTTIPATTITTILTTTSTIQECSITALSQSEVRIGFGILPRIKKITVTLDKILDELGITGNDLAFDATKGIRILKTTIEGNTITATVLFWGTLPGTYNVSVGECGSALFVIKRF